MTYYTDSQGRAVQGTQFIGNHAYNFGTNGTYNLKGDTTGYLHDNVLSQNGGYRWYQKGSLYTGFRQYAGTYYYFTAGRRINNSWESAWGMYYYLDNDGRAVQGNPQNGDASAYYFGNNGTYFVRDKKTGKPIKPSIPIAVIGETTPD